MKRNGKYSKVINWIRTRLTFHILRSTLLCLREQKYPSIMEEHQKWTILNWHVPRHVLALYRFTVFCFPLLFFFLFFPKDSFILICQNFYKSNVFVIFQIDVSFSSFFHFLNFNYNDSVVF